jgi:hypothetical protein
MLDKSSLREMDSNALLKLVSIVRKQESISTISSEGQQEVHMTLTTSYRYVPRVMDGFTNTQQSQESAGGLLPVTV